MNARKRYEQERPFAANVMRSAEHLAKEPMHPDAARTTAIFAIAWSILDLSDAIREWKANDQ